MRHPILIGLQRLLIHNDIGLSEIIENRHPHTPPSLLGTYREVRLVILLGVIQVIGAQLQRLLSILGDDIDHPSQGIGAIEGRRGALDDFDALDILQVNAIIVNIIKGLPGHTLPIHKEEHIFAPEAHHIDIGHPPFVGEVDTRKLVF